MKKMDLHIHTVKTQSDYDFAFSVNALKKYVEEQKIDAIAVTNHNLFDLEQYNQIVELLSGIATVFPGIEVNIGRKLGHLLVIADPSNAADFSERCREIQSAVTSPTEYVSVEQFMEILPNLSQYLLIPHMDKSPNVDDYTLSMLGDYIACGEVGSIKKFVYFQKDEKMPTPVYFSDCRLTDGGELPVRATYIDTEDTSLESIKLCLQDKTKVSLSDENGSMRFWALPYLPLSTGLNVIMGGRSSGKSYTLNKLYKTKSSLRTLPLVGSFRDYFQKVKEAQELNKKVCGNCYNYEYDGYVFVNELGERMRPNYLTEYFPKYIAKHGMPKMRFHDLRHSCASLLLANGVPLKQIQEWLGHSDFSTTANIYAHLDYRSKISSAQAMEQGMLLPRSDDFGSRWENVTEQGKITEPDLNPGF